MATYITERRKCRFSSARSFVTAMKKSSADKTRLVSLGERSQTGVARVRV